MSRRLTGEQIILYKRQVVGVDAFDRPIYGEVPVQIENVLIAPSSSNDVLNQQNLSGEIIVYDLYLPKDDAHDWEDCKVEIRGKTFKTVGQPLQYHDHLVPLDWNKKVRVKRYE